MPSMSADLSPASVIALRTAQVASARVVLPEPRMYSVSPTPTIAYLSRRYLGLVASTSLGSGILFPRAVASRIILFFLTRAMASSTHASIGACSAIHRRGRCPRPTVHRRGRRQRPKPAPQWRMDAQDRSNPTARARDLKAAIAAASDAIEATRRLPEPLVARLHEARLFRMLLPRSVGGDQLDP